MYKNFIQAFFLFSILFLVASCDKDDDVEIPNEEELITTVNFTLTPTDGGDAVSLSFVDLDGDGGNDATITGGTLMANTSYTGSIELLNESESPAENITEEVEEEAEEHQFFFESTISDLTVTYNDQDADGNPIGLSSSISTGEAASGTLTVTLRHEPAKTAEGVAAGNIDNAGGETDIEVSFPIDVQ